MCVHFQLLEHGCAQVATQGQIWVQEHQHCCQLLSHLFNNTEPVKVINEISRSGQESDDVTTKDASETEAQLKSAPAALWEILQMAHDPGAEMFVGSELVLTPALKSRAQETSPEINDESSCSQVQQTSGFQSNWPLCGPQVRPAGKLQLCVRPACPTPPSCPRSTQIKGKMSSASWTNEGTLALGPMWLRAPCVSGPRVSLDPAGAIAPPDGFSAFMAK